MSTETKQSELIQLNMQLLESLRHCSDLLGNSDVKHYISSDLGEQSRLHAALNAARAAIAKAEGR